MTKSEIARANWEPRTAGLIVFACLLVCVVCLTGFSASPCLFVLFIPVLIASQRGRPAVALNLSVLAAAITILDSLRRTSGHPPVAMMGVAAGFPTVALCAAFLQRPVTAEHEALRDHASEMDRLMDMSRMLDSAYDVEMALNLILLSVRSLTECDLCAVYLKDSTGLAQSGSNAGSNVEVLELQLKAASGDPDLEHGRRNIPKTLLVARARWGDWTLDQWVKGQVEIAACWAPEIKPAEVLTDRSDLHKLDPSMRSFACLPLACIDGFLGMIYVGFQRERALSSSDMIRVEHLAERAGMPVHRVLVREDIHWLAFRDAKTGLANYRQFEQNLSREMARSARYGRQVSLLLMDIDHFKKFNDQHGHPAGDALLAELAEMLAQTLRAVDMPARYGGEEFVVICPETGPEDAHVIADRLCRTIAEAKFLNRTTGDVSVDDSGLSVTISVGYATFPDTALTAKDLIDRADIALYAAKRGGRNTVRGAEVRAAHSAAA